MGPNNQIAAGRLPIRMGESVGDCISRPMAVRRLLADDARMVPMTQLSNAARHSEMVWQGSGLVGLEQTVACGLDADSRNEPIRFAACLARRLGWRLSLVPLSDAATEDERLDRLLAASARDQAGFVVTEAIRSDPGITALVELSRGAACPLIAVRRGAPALGTGPILCGIDSRGSSGPTARAASRLANAIGARLAVPVDLVIEEGEPAKRLGELGRREDAALLAVGAPSGDTPGEDGVVAAVLRDSRIPVMLVPGGTAAARLSEAA
jgi:nucleotide-binding universal stress UspA family protein